jgi:hypothetical protein
MTHDLVVSREKCGLSKGGEETPHTHIGRGIGHTAGALRGNLGTGRVQQPHGHVDAAVHAGGSRRSGPDQAWQPVSVTFCMQVSRKIVVERKGRLLFLVGEDRIISE